MDSAQSRKYLLIKNNPSPLVTSKEEINMAFSLICNLIWANVKTWTKHLKTLLLSNRRKTVLFSVAYPCSLITCRSGLLITDATFLQHRDWRESWNGSRLFPLYQSLIYLSQNNPHSSYEPRYLCETDWIWSSGGGMRLRKWVNAKAERWIQ